MDVAEEIIHGAVLKGSAGASKNRLLLITGPTGTRKSYVIQEIEDLATSLGRTLCSFANNAINVIHIKGLYYQLCVLSPNLEERAEGRHDPHNPSHGKQTAEERAAGFS